MRLKTSIAPRRGFSLLEVLLASVIAVLLLSGLYVAMDVQLRQAEVGRGLVQQSTLVRAIVQRVSNDLAPSITVISQVKSTSSSSSSSGSTSGTSSSSSTTSGSTGSSPSSGSSSSGSSMSEAISDSGSYAGMAIPSQAGVIGDTSTVSIYSSRVPNSTTQGTDSAGEPPPTAPDVRMVTYSVTENEGLIRQEYGFLTSEANGLEAEGVTTTLIAAEVTQIQLQYWDGSTWSGNWDGSALGDDLLTPIGPPLAIELRIWIKQPSGAEPKMYRQVIALNTGMPPPTTEDQLATQQTTPME